jgi:putative PIN family toxin of toxin-antitoxin system
MRILIDTNIALSAFLSPDGRTADVLKFAIHAEHTICLCTWSIDELRVVVKRKFPDKMQALELFLLEFSYELLLTPAALPQDLPPIRDVNDLPILASAIMGDVDLLLTGDKDFDAVDVGRPVILSPARFMELYG